MRVLDMGMGTLIKPKDGSSVRTEATIAGWRWQADEYSATHCMGGGRLGPRPARNTTWRWGGPQFLPPSEVRAGGEPSAYFCCESQIKNLPSRESLSLSRSERGTLS